MSTTPFTSWFRRFGSRQPGAFIVLYQVFSGFIITYLFSSNTTVSLTNSTVDVPAEMTEWPLFHSGVADALAIEPDKVPDMFSLILF